MIIVRRGHELWKQPSIAQKMFLDRRKHFVDRLGWELEVDANGYEIDQYDGVDPVYVIVSSPTNPHLASLRLIPMNTPNMISQVFPQLLDAVRDPIELPHSIECTRMVCAEEADTDAVLKALAATAAVMELCKHDSLYAVFYPLMLRVYRKLGAEPDVVAKAEIGTKSFLLGRWRFEHQTLIHLKARSCLHSTDLSVSAAAVDKLRATTSNKENV